MAKHIERAFAVALAVAACTSPEAAGQAEQVALNGRLLAVAANGDLPQLAPQAIAAGRVELLPATITFFAIPGAGNPACR